MQAIFETMEADDALGVAKGGGTKLMTAMKSAAPPAAPAPAAKPAVSPPAAKPAAPKRPPVPPPVAEKKGKGCGSSAAVIVLGMVAVAYWFLA